MNTRKQKNREDTLRLRAARNVWPRALLFMVLSACSAVAGAQSMALTFDDGLNPDAQPKAQRWNREMLTALKDMKVTAMIFPAVSSLGGNAGIGLVREWAEAGHTVGNHTTTHRSLASSKVTLEEFIEDVEEADAVLRRIPKFVPMLRFPYLKEGDTAEKRDGIRRWMKQHDYRPAPVSIDASDWYYNQVFVKFIDAGQADRAERVKDAYVAHLLDRAQYYDALSRQVLARSPKHVLLLHTNAINAASIHEVITAFRGRGWKLISPRAAFDDTLYAMKPDVLPAGESIIWALAKERGVPDLRYPAEDSVYEEPKLKQLGLLPD